MVSPNKRDTKDFLGQDRFPSESKRRMRVDYIRLERFYFRERPAERQRKALAGIAEKRHGKNSREPKFSPRRIFVAIAESNCKHMNIVPSLDKNFRGILDEIRHTVHFRRESVGEECYSHRVSKKFMMMPASSSCDCDAMK